MAVMALMAVRAVMALMAVLAPFWLGTCSVGVSEENGSTYANAQIRVVE